MTIDHKSTNFSNQLLLLAPGLPGSAALVQLRASLRCVAPVHRGDRVATSSVQSQKGRCQGPASSTPVMVGWLVVVG